MFPLSLKIFQLYFYVARLQTPSVRVTARIPMAQSVLESGDGWTSNLAVNANNIFGMKQPQVRATTSLGPSASGFATFASKYSAIRDYILFLSQLGITSDALLADYINSGRYTPDAHYKTRLATRIAAQAPALINPIQFAAAGTAVAVGAVVGVKVINKLV